MHELGVVFYVVKDVKNIAIENAVESVSAVTLEIGEVSGIVHDYLIDCFDWAKKKEPVIKDAVMKIETIEAFTLCEDCNKEYKTVIHGKTCPYCGNSNTYLVRGNEFLIKNIEVRD